MDIEDRIAPAPRKISLAASLGLMIGLSVLAWLVILLLLF